MPDDQKYEPWYTTIELGYAWIGGFRPYMYWANTTNCFHRMSNFTYLEIPAFQHNVTRGRLSAHDKIEAYTLIIQNFTRHVWYCTSALQTASRYWEARVD